MPAPGVVPQDKESIHYPLEMGLGRRGLHTAEAEPRNCFVSDMSHFDSVIPDLAILQ